MVTVCTVIVLSYRLCFIVSSKPRTLEIFTINSSSVNLQWTPPDTPNGVIRQYSIQLNGTNVTNLSSNVLMYTIGRLLPDTVYVVGLTAYTSAGEGEPNSTTVITRKLLNPVAH